MWRYCTVTESTKSQTNIRRARQDENRPHSLPLIQSKCNSRPIQDSIASLRKKRVRRSQQRRGDDTRRTIRYEVTQKNENHKLESRDTNLKAKKKESNQSNRIKRICLSNGNGMRTEVDKRKNTY